MQLVQYLLSVATRHELAKDEHEEEIKEYFSRLKRSRSGRHNFTLTYDDEAALLKAVIGSVRGKPSCLKNLSLPAIASLAYILKANVENEPYTEGHEILNKLGCETERTIVLLKSFSELKEKSWIEFREAPGKAFTDQPPFCWLSSRIILGSTFHKEIGGANQNCHTFDSNDAYLDAAFQYLHRFFRDDSEHLRVTDPLTDLPTFQPEGWFRRLSVGMEASTFALPAAEAKKRFSLSAFQHLTIIGMLGKREGDLRYDFGDPGNVTRLFARGRVCRKRMMEHLFGEKSELIRQRLVEAPTGNFGESLQLTHLGVTALLGKQSDKKTANELKMRVKKKNLFDFEEPKIKKGSVLLPSSVMEAIESIIFSESREGRQIRKSWHASLPAAWGSPSGTTVLLHGPPGTGKSLTAQYLASELKIPLLKIDASKVLSCWIGESEQNVRQIFDDYSALLKDLGIAPVLLLNEADQLLGARGAGNHSVDRMNNNMQNLFLEGLERFSGILVATTNRRDLLDEAFSRRFTYKLELPTPDKNLRVELWKNHLPMERLAPDLHIVDLADLNLTGGEIRLVIERVVRLLAYRGITKIDRNVLMQIAKEELASRMKRNGNVIKIGFGAGQQKI